MSWTVVIDQLDTEQWSIVATADDQSGDHQGTNLVGDEQAARAFAAEQFGADVEPVVNRRPVI